jgi:hypothetical protein
MFLTNKKLIGPSYSRPLVWAEPPKLEPTSVGAPKCPFRYRCRIEFWERGWGDALNQLPSLPRCFVLFIGDKCELILIKLDSTQLMNYSS